MPASIFASFFIQGSVSGFDLLHEDRFKSFATVTRSLRLAALNGVDLVNLLISNFS